MSGEEKARMIAMLRLHFGQNHVRLAKLVSFATGEPFEGLPSEHGAALLREMEQHYGLDPGEAETMTMDELMCSLCGSSQWSICYRDDTPKECGNCGEMTAMLPPGLE